MKEYDTIKGLFEEMEELAVFILVCIFSETLICALFLYRHNFLKDVIWVLPIEVVFGVMGLFLLDRYYLAREVMMMKVKARLENK